ncbi:MAG: hypothetical protein ABJN40_13035 [Sneathiella sp.]
MNLLNAHARPLALVLSVFMAAFMVPFSPAYAESLSYSGPSEKKQFTLTLLPPSETQLNKLSIWTARIKGMDASAKASLQMLLNATDYKISGGMPAHGHGLPTEPRVRSVAEDKAGDLLLEIEGIKFQMWGHWVLSVEIPALADKAEVAFVLKP